MSPILVPDRVPVFEHLDGDGPPSDAVFRSLRDLRAINRWLGGTLAYRRMVRRFGDPARLVVLDLGSGTGDLPSSLPPGARRVALDAKTAHLAYGRQLAPEGIARVAGDAFRLPLRDASVDVVTSSHFFHHFPPAENAAILRESLRVARVGVGVTDTRRHRIPLAFVRAVGATPLWGPITRHDAPASVRQGYTPGEAAQIAREAGARRWEVLRQLPFRFTLLLWT
ncbi:MAG TPA: methyltransferase domain-containing protein [Thermoanaerobaculia bacterium]|nr:methyltransferase domain-containing protein [Thermoanaerobaculia bacterium]